MTIARDVRNHLRHKPYVLEALEKGIVNLSELSRQMQHELKITNLDAIKAAIRRFSSQLQKHKHKREEKVLKLLKESAITIYNGKSVVIADKSVKTKAALKVNFEDKFVYLLEKSDLPELTRILKIHKNCVMIAIQSPEELETTPGVIAFLTSLLAEHNVNIIEFISCWTDTIIVVEREDSLKTYEILTNLMD